MNNLTQETMDKLLIFASLIILSNGGLVRVPKIYNALISSDENLSPSHAVPVVEPVLRTTALGVAFPPILVHSTLEELPKESGNNNNAKKQVVVSQEVPKETNIYYEGKKEDKKSIIPQVAYHGSLYPLAIDPFPYSYTSELLYSALPYYHQPIFVDLELLNDNNKKKIEQPTPGVNFKKNPEIPDVPPPQLPVKDKLQRSS